MNTHLTVTSLKDFVKHRYLSKGQIVELSEGGELMRATKALDFLPGFNLEGFPNRDSTVYGKLYGIEDANTILRGTIRYTGFSQSVRMLQFLGNFVINHTRINHKWCCCRFTGSRTSSFAASSRT